MMWPESDSPQAETISVSDNSFLSSISATRLHVQGAIPTVTHRVFLAPRPPSDPSKQVSLVNAYVIQPQVISDTQIGIIALNLVPTDFKASIMETMTPKDALFPAQMQHIMATHQLESA